MAGPDRGASGAVAGSGGVGGKGGLGQGEVVSEDAMDSLWLPGKPWGRPRLWLR